MSAVPFAVLVGLGLVPLAAAGTLGTETEPEMSDPPGDINYDLKYPGPRDHAYLDVIAGWLAYNETADDITFSLKLGGALPPPSNAFLCSFSHYVRVGSQVVGNLTFNWNRRPQSVTSSVYWHRDVANAATGSIVEVGHRFAYSDSTPGIYVWAIPRVKVQSFGEGSGEIVGMCQESYAPGGITSIATNSDEATGRVFFSWADFRRAPSTEDEDPFAIDSKRSGQTPEATGQSGALALPLVLAAIRGAILALGHGGWKEERRRP